MCFYFSYNGLQSASCGTKNHIKTCLGRHGIIVVLIVISEFYRSQNFRESILSVLYEYPPLLNNIKNIPTVKRIIRTILPFQHFIQIRIKYILQEFYGLFLS